MTDTQRKTEAPIAALLEGVSDAERLAFEQFVSDLPEHQPDMYINRELSWLEFNRRVLEEAQEQDAPLLARAKFAAIFASNLDEFFMIRVAGAKRKVVAGIGDAGPDGRTPVQQLREIQRVTQELLKTHARLVVNDLFQELRQAGIAIDRHVDLEPSQQSALRRVFEHEIFPVLTPQAVDRGRRFPHVSNDSLNLIVVLRGDESSRFARVKIPALLPRFVPVPDSEPEAETGKVLADQTTPRTRYTFLEDIVAANLDRLFPGSDVIAAYPFHLLRDSDVEPDEDDDDQEDLLEIMRETLSQRPFGTTVRIDIDKTMPQPVLDWLMDQIHADRQDLYVVEGPLQMEDLFELQGLHRPDLDDPTFSPASVFVPARGDQVDDGNAPESDIFRILRDNDVLLHHPYQSFNAVVEFIRAASRDPHVVAIKQSLYRLGKDSPLIPALIEARDDDTQVAVLVELKARFDEESNISWAQTLERAGVHVAYGLSGLKTHAKVTLVVRREPDGLRRYVHLSTGNYNANTARTYEDIGLLSSREDLATDATELFNHLTGFGTQDTYNTMWTAPRDMRTRFLKAIFDETERHRAHGDGHMIMKMNSLVDHAVIRALYAASQAGVKIDLIVRGICCLRPGVKGVSETIRVVSLVGRFLEHSRIYYFHNGGEPKIYLGSADAMERNFDRRVEVLFPVHSAELRGHIREEVLDRYLLDTVNARVLQPDTSWVAYVPEEGDEPFNVQAWFMGLYRDRQVVGPRHDASVGEVTVSPG
ncbi:MAG: polyphosphate kinase 1 [Chloroflexota bacterium]|nr:polyphosphate kinase 1 [Chloroflexota bacterium]